MSELRKTYEGGLFFMTLTVVGWLDVFTTQSLGSCRVTLMVKPSGRSWNWK